MDDQSSINAPINIGITASGTPSVQQAAAALRGMQDQLTLVKTQLREAGVAGSSFSKVTADSKELLFQASAALKSYSASVDKYGSDSRQAHTAAKNLASAFTAVKSEVLQLDTAQKQLNTDAQSFHGSIGSNMLGSLAGWAAGFLSVYAAINLLKGAFTAASDFDAQLDKLAVSSGKTGAAFQQASEGLHQMVLGVSEGTIFSEDKVLAGLTKFRDRGFDVFKMTKEQLAPVLDAATATMQDLGAVADATAVTMRQFNLTLNDTEHVANLMYEAFKLAGTGAEGFQEQILAAGAAAAASGVSLESYLAVTTRLKQLGYSDSQAAQFQKLFFAAAEAPNAKQLQSMRNSGVDFYRTPDSYDSELKDQGTGLTGLMNFGKKLIGKNSGLDDVQRAKAQATAWQAVQTQLVSLADAQDKVNVGIFVYGEYAESAQTKIDSLKDTQQGWKDLLTSTNAEIAAVTAQLQQAKTSFDNLASGQIEGMNAYDAAIEKAELASQRQELANLNLTRSFGDMDGAIKKTAMTAKDLERKLSDLRSEELKGERAYSDTSFNLGQQIKALELKKNNLAPQDIFQQNDLDRQIAALQRQKTQVDLRDSIEFDPQKRAIQQAADAADIAAGKKLAPGDSKDIIAGINGIGGALGKRKKGDDTLKALQEEVDALKLEKAVKFGDELFAIKEKAQQLREQLGLVAAEEPFEKIMAELPTVAARYAALNTRLGDLKKARDTESAAIEGYDAQIRTNESALRGYESHIADLTKQQASLNDETKRMEEIAAGMTKPLKDEAALIEELKGSVMGAGMAFEFLGKRGGGMIVSLLGDKGQNLGILERIRDTLKAADGVKTGAADVNNDVYGAMEKVAAQLKNLQIELGSDLAGSLTGLMGGIVKLTDAILHSALLHPIDAVANTMADPNSVPNKIGNAFNLRNYFATGGIVSGYGYGDTVPAMLTPGEEVLTRKDPRHAMNGGGGVSVHIHGPVTVRNDGDLEALAAKISRRIASGFRNANSGMPANA